MARTPRASSRCPPRPHLAVVQPPVTYLVSLIYDLRPTRHRWQLSFFKPTVRRVRPHPASPHPHLATLAPSSPANPSHPGRAKWGSSPAPAAATRPRASRPPSPFPRSFSCLRRWRQLAGRGIASTCRCTRRSVTGSTACLSRTPMPPCRMIGI